VTRKHGPLRTALERSLAAADLDSTTDALVELARAQADALDGSPGTTERHARSASSYGSTLQRLGLVAPPPKRSTTPAPAEPVVDVVDMIRALRA